MLKHALCICTLLAASVQLQAQADERGALRAQMEPKGFLYGIGLGVSEEIYQGYDRRVIPLPILGYRGDKLSILGPFISYEILEINDIELVLQASPRFQGYDESDSDVFKGMAERDFSMDGGVGIKYERENWKFGISAVHDVLDKSDGYEVSTSLAKVYKSGPFFYEPSLSVSYLDSHHVDYYYGVRLSEATSARPQYVGDNATNVALGFSISTPIFFGGFTQLAFDYTWFDDSITDSPLVDSDASFAARLLFSKFF
ncbi:MULTISPECIES: MipA/OmpV family protein [unclassified Pseudoalteromonas]|uniref:MipA/OmpV family protein n=1 Tax=unclassified Pseudoalteromonas TaxID=194690 RepID=UPI00209822C0|nr:MipA/OmpV family protein [Pseudoalteromonas sp. XMcav2-N]MCO7191219.1 MipA/OmpV family protein [Pseudoalteromonas sp. XMcav2-N]